MLYVCVSDEYSIILLYKPCLGFFFCDLLVSAHFAVYPPPKSDPLASPSQHNVEVHSEYPSVRVILDAQVNMFIDPKAKVASVAEVLLLQFIFLHLQPLFQYFQSLVSSHSHVAGHLLIPFDSEGPDGESGYREHWGLAGQVF